jgi:hypothetical protein
VTTLKLQVYSSYSASSPIGWVKIVAGSTTLYDSVNPANFSGYILATVPAGTNLSTISVTANVESDTTPGDSAELDVSGIFIH